VTTILPVLALNLFGHEGSLGAESLQPAAGWLGSARYAGERRGGKMPAAGHQAPARPALSFEEASEPGATKDRLSGGDLRRCHIQFVRVALVCTSSRLLELIAH
jgi:hypothetical protein